TILSRCMQFNLRRLSVEEFIGQLEYFLDREELEYEQPALGLLARAADGSMRDGLSLLDQALAAGNGKLESAAVEDMLGTVEQRHLNTIVEALIDGEPGSALAAIGEVFSLARDLSRLLADLAEMLHRVALIQQVPDYRDDSRSDWQNLVDYAERLDPEDVQLYYQIAVTGRRDLGLAPSDRSGCEMTILRMFAFQPAGAGDPTRPARPAAKTAPAADSPAAPKSAPAAEVREDPPAHTAPDRGGAVAPARPADGAGAQVEPLSSESWPRVLQALELNGSVKAVAGMLAVGQVDDQRVEFRLGRDDLNLVTDRFKASLAKALHDYSGLERRVDFKPVGDESELVTPAKLDNDRRSRAQADAEAAVAEDPLVKRMQEKFDAEIVPGSVRPANPQRQGEP
ncbi:MAG: DNA polymerase III subunit gamma/tau C-terminal domain-containing protein, partial [Wenzhouxiangellaceae bacterium]